MLWINSANARSVMVLVGVMALSVALAVGLQVGDVRLPMAVRLPLSGTVMAAGLWAACRYWRNVDEAGRAAQKWAWFWGGSIGMALGMIGLALAAVGPVDLVPPGARPGMLLFYGGGGMVVAQMVGFVVAWAWWWARRR